MALRDWRVRRVVWLSVIWMLGVVTATAVQALLQALRLRRQLPGDDIIVVLGHVPGGAATVFLPPLVLLAAWWWARARSSSRK